eukprot:CAMPEP_0115326522 /NCGR_PEP_ID=MMETSP0270-20121206/83618_1 /TAXON_ID=71861 /ORGANISM="Scrippsiella trochoidea, Strain CCMP3099" /LENGTH=86 /DNA_ID=CAMNT_0002746835 /DNA_START=397 /DNA_END=657 /DNA_ORIENTATION=-
MQGLASRQPTTKTDPEQSLKVWQQWSKSQRVKLIAVSKCKCVPSRKLFEIVGAISSLGAMLKHHRSMGLVSKGLALVSELSSPGRP